MTEKRDKRGRFQKGKSGNPKGRPSSASAELRQSLAKHGQAIADQVVKAAKNGDMVAARIVLDRILPALKSQSPPVVLNLSEDATMADIARAVIEAGSNGHTSPESMIAMLNALGSLAKVLESTELEARIRALEEKNGKP